MPEARPHEDLFRQRHSDLSPGHTGSCQARALARLAALETAGDVIVVSDITRLECRLKPIRLGDAAALARFDAFFARPDARHTPLTTAALDRATVLRANLNFKLGDALNLGAAIEGGCDHRLDRCNDIVVEVLA